MFKSFNDTYEEWQNDIWFANHFIHDRLRLPEIAQSLRVPTEHDFRRWYRNPNWQPTDEAPEASFHTPTWAKVSLASTSNLPDSIEEPNSHPQVLYSPALLQAIQRRTKTPILYSSGLIQQINRRTASIVPSPDSCWNLMPWTIIVSQDVIRIDC